MSRQKQDRGRLITRRALFMGGLQLAAVSALGARLYYLQFIRNAEFTTLAENNRIKLQLLAPPRGLILDRNEVILAGNRQNYQLFLDVSALPGKDKVADVLARADTLIALGEKRMAQIQQAYRTNPYSAPLLIRDHLEWEDVSRIELHLMELPGMSIEVGQVRYYPFVDKAAHLLGHVGAVTESELKSEPKNESLLRIPEFKIGKNGVEKKFEENLRGKAGIRQLEVDVHGLPVRKLSTRESEPGQALKLTIDARLQEFASEKIKEESAAVVVMEVDTGNILTFASMPGFDPNIFSKGIPHEYWSELQANIRDPLLNKAIQGQYPPGSTFKMLVGLAGLKTGTIKPGTRVNCPGHFYLGSHRFNCWKEGGHGTVDIHQAIAQSCDTFFYTIGQRTGVEPIRDMARAFSIGDDTLLGLVGEKPGLPPDPAWKQKRYKQKWQTGDTVNASIGQGYVLATPLQLCVMTARMVNGGKEVRPRLVAAKEPEEFPQMDIDIDHLALIKESMDLVVNSGSGTAYGKRITEERFAFGGKTGTSQVRKILKRGMRQESLPWEHRHHALFVGYAPIHAPKYACAVIIEHGGGGSAAAAPVARDVLLKMQQLAEGDGKEDEKDEGN